jgi:hypothetical protein
MTETRFWKIENEPKNDFESTVKKLIAFGVEREDLKFLSHMRDRVNTMSQINYELLTEAHMRIKTLDLCFNETDKDIVNNLKLTAKTEGHYNEFIKAMSENIVTIAPWHTEIAEVNEKMRDLMLRVFTGGTKSDPIMLLLDLMADQVTWKEKILTMALRTTINPIRNQASKKALNFKWDEKNMRYVLFETEEKEPTD